MDLDAVIKVADMGPALQGQSGGYSRILGGGHFRTNGTSEIKTVEFGRDAQLTWTYEYAGSLELGSAEGRGEVSGRIIGVDYGDRSHAVETLVETASLNDKASTAF